MYLLDSVCLSICLQNISQKVMYGFWQNFVERWSVALRWIVYCKTLYFLCVLISWLCNVEILLHFISAFSQCSTIFYQAFDGQTEFLRVFNFAILSYSWNSRKFDAHEEYVFYSSFWWRSGFFWGSWIIFQYFLLQIGHKRALCRSTRTAVHTIVVYVCLHQRSIMFSACSCIRLSVHTECR